MIGAVLATIAIAATRKHIFYTACALCYSAHVIFFSYFVSPSTRKRQQRRRRNRQHKPATQQQQRTNERLDAATASPNVYRPLRLDIGSGVIASAAAANVDNDDGDTASDRCRSCAPGRRANKRCNNNHCGDGDETTRCENFKVINSSPRHRVVGAVGATLRPPPSASARRP